jgi:L-amino acid N-acyltransferase YncA
MIRLATPKDYPALVDIINDVILNTNAIYREEPHTLETRMPYFKEKEDKNIPIYVYELDHKVVGFITYGPFRDNPGYRYTIEHSLHIDKQYRGQGIGKKLLKALISDLMGSEFRLIVGVIDVQNRASRKLHESIGFKLSGQIENVAIKHSEWLDVCFYTYDLKENKR